MWPWLTAVRERTGMAQRSWGSHHWSRLGKTVGPRSCFLYVLVSLHFLMFTNSLGSIIVKIKRKFFLQRPITGQVWFLLVCYLLLELLSYLILLASKQTRSSPFETNSVHKLQCTDRENEFGKWKLSDGTRAKSHSESWLVYGAGLLDVIRVQAKPEKKMNEKVVVWWFVLF